MEQTESNAVEDIGEHYVLERGTIDISRDMVLVRDHQTWAASWVVVVATMKRCVVESRLLVCVFVVVVVAGLLNSVRRDKERGCRDWYNKEKLHLMIEESLMNFHYS